MAAGCAICAAVGLVLDLVGFGEQGTPLIAGVHNLDGGLATAHLVGQSWGGWIGKWMALAVLLPFAGLILLLGVAWLVHKIPVFGPLLTRNFAYLVETWGRPGLWLADQIDAKRILRSVIDSRSGLHGSDRLLTDKEALAAWDNQQGVVLGTANGHILRYAGEGAVILEARAGGGKGVRHVVPTLLTPADESRVILDPKAELLAITGRYRRDLGQTVRAVDPEQITDCADDARINLLTAVIPSTGETIAARAGWIVQLLMAPSEKVESSSFWDDSARGLLNSLLVWVACAPDDLLKVDRSLMGVRALLEMGQNKLRDEIRDNILANTGSVDPNAAIVINSLSQFPDMADETFSSLPTNALNSLTWLNVPGWRRALCAEGAVSDNLWDLTDLRRPGLDIYICVRATMLKSYPDPARLLIGCIVNSLLDAGKLKSKVRLVIDEMRQLGRCEPLVQAVEIGRTVCRPLIVFQGRSQAEKIYGEEGADLLWGAAACHIYLTASDTGSAKRISELTGTKTVFERSISGGRDGNSLKESGRPVMTEGEVLRLASDRSIAIVPGTAAAVLGSIFYYSDPAYAGTFDEFREGEDS
jgi:type IV secretion system protein VirD4